MKARVLNLLGSGKKATSSRAKAENNPERVFRSFLDRLRRVIVLDPACGSGNFLYVTLQALKDLEKEAIFWGAETLKIPLEFPGVGPQVVRGIELNAYAAELARVTIWIGEIQWMLSNGFGYRRDPILQPLKTVEERDAILDRSDPNNPRPAEWPEAEFIVGNPPFLGGKKLRGGLGKDYVNDLFTAWEGFVPREADLVSYWHEKARQLIKAGRVKRAGLLATQSIRMGANRKVLKRVKQSGDIFMAWSDEPWVVEGAALRISIVGQDDGSEKKRTLDGKPVEVIFADLKGGDVDSPDLTEVRVLMENQGLSFMGVTKGGPFELDEDKAESFLKAPKNVNGRANADVIRLLVNGKRLTDRRPPSYVVDFGVDMSEAEAAQYELPFEHVRKWVLPKRQKNNRPAYRERWWIHVEPRPALRKALEPLSRYIATPRVAEHRVFVFLPMEALPDSRLYAFARDDDFFFGVLHSRVHELWALNTSSRHGVGNQPTYNNTTCFETFPFPWPLGQGKDALTRQQRGRHDAIAMAARALDEQRQRWLNPPELVIGLPPLARGFPPRLVPKSSAAEKELRKRTLTQLYNARPAWLEAAHRELDAVVLEAYGWPEGLSEKELLKRLLALNQQRPGVALDAAAGEESDEAEAED
jgi:type II restriction/modification system DNA methylase subunit YeeA